MAEREILFRGKRTDNREWIEGDIHKNTDFSKAHIHPNGERVRSFDVIPETVGQYIGLTDKNGKRIFEGDIVSYFNKEILNSEVIYKDGCFMFRFISEYTQRMRQTKQEPIFDNVSVCGEIIGNIWDNPEILKNTNP